MHSISNKVLNRRPALPARQQGAVAVIVALSLVGLIGIVGLALDLGKLFVAKSELQNSADACALAAARELTGANTHQLKLAAAAGIATGQRHQVLFQGEQIIVERVTFSDHLTGVYQSAFEGTGALGMRFVRCEVNRSDIANWFIQVLNLMPGVDIGDQRVAASAVATLAPSQITSCAIPVGICGEDVSASTPVGTWLESVIGPPAGGGQNDEGNLTGNFMWVDFTPPGGGASELAEHLTGPGVCNLPAIGTDVGEAGVKSSLAAAWNSRFGIYHGNVKQSDAIPDYSGYAYTETNWPSKSDAFDDFKMRRATNEPYQGDNATGLKTNGSIEGATFLKEHGSDRRLATAAVVDCAGLMGGSTTSAVEDWACVLMLHPINNSQGGSGTGATRMYLEYLGPSNNPNSPCATVGVPSGPGGAGPLVPALVR